MQNTHATLHPAGLAPASQSAPVILRIRDVQARTGLGRATIYKLCAAGRFPVPVDLLGTGRAVGWSEQAVNAWINDRLAAAGQSVGAGK